MVWRVVRWIFSIPYRAAISPIPFIWAGVIMPAGIRRRTIQKSGIAFGDDPAAGEEVLVYIPLWACHSIRLWGVLTG